MISKASLSLNRTHAELTAQYVFAHCRARHGSKWLGSRVPGSHKPGPEEREALPADPVRLLKTFQLYAVPYDSHAGLLGWLEGRHPLILRQDIPTPDEMLEIQCQGLRYVTLMIEPEAQFKRYGRHPGAFEFLLHDLEHAHKFFGDPELTRGQRTFFNLLRKLQPRLHGFSPEFQTALDYLRADMNSHPLHLFKYLKAIVLNEFLRNNRRRELYPFFDEIYGLWEMPPEITAAARQTNEPGLETDDGQTLLAEWFFTGTF